MDRETTQRLLRESIVFLCRTHLGNDANGGFEVDGIICVSRRRRHGTDSFDDPRPTVFKFHELVTEDSGLLRADGPSWFSPGGGDQMVINQDAFISGSKKRKADELQFDDPSALLSKNINVSGQVNSDGHLSVADVCPVKEEPLWSSEPNTFDTIQMLMKCSGDSPLPEERAKMSRKTAADQQALNLKNLPIEITPELTNLCARQEAVVCSSKTSCIMNERETSNVKPVVSSSPSNVVKQWSSDEKLVVDHSVKICPPSSTEGHFSASPDGGSTEDDSVDEQTATIEQSTPRRCELCGSVFADFPAFNVHCATVHNRYACPFCTLSFPGESARERHLFEHTGEPVDDDNIEDLSGANDSMGLPDSSSRTFHDANLDTHHSNSRHSGINAVEILSDSEEGGSNGGFVDTQLLSRRGTLSTQALRAIVSLDPSRPFVCDICRMQFFGSAALCDHCTTVHRRVPCPYCGRSFSQKASMERHQRQHTGERPFRCSMCDSSYTRKENLQTHFSRMHASVGSHQSVPDFVALE